MPTEKLFYTDAYRSEAEATVLSCLPAENGRKILLNRTIFYPTGGGQPCDLGTIADAVVLDVFEENGQIVHLCDRALVPGSVVTLRVDFARRFVFMQQHTAEHIVSGLIRAQFGLNNVGFHMGTEAVQLDYDGTLTAVQLAQIERQTNALIFKNEEVSCFVPPQEELGSYDYRSKKALTGDVRLVRVPDADLCACCGLHIARTGEIGLVRLQNPVRFRGGTRLELLCGEKVERLLSLLSCQCAEISSMLSARQDALSAAVSRLVLEQHVTRERAAALEARIFSLRAQALSHAPFALIFEEDLSPDALRRFANTLLSYDIAFCAVLSGQDGNYRYALASAQGDLRQTVQTFNERLHGRGGGKAGFAQGSVCASRAEIEAFFSTYPAGK